MISSTIGLKIRDMLSKITWSEYLMAIGLVVGLYYIYVFIRYYASDFQNKIIHQRENNLVAAMPDDQIENQTSIHNQEYDSPETDEFEQIEALVEEIRTYISTDSRSNTEKADLKEDLKKIVQKYPDLKETPYKSAINDIILTECVRYGTDTIDEGDVEQLWE